MTDRFEELCMQLQAKGMAHDEAADEARRRIERPVVDLDDEPEIEVSDAIQIIRVEDD